jgi:hypothetical protein
MDANHKGGKRQGRITVYVPAQYLASKDSYNGVRAASRVKKVTGRPAVPER